MGWIQNLWIFHMNLGMNIQRASVQHPFGSLKHQGSVAGLLIHNTPAVFVQKWGIPQCMPILIEKLRFQTPSDLDSAPKFETQPMSDLKDRFSHDITPPATTHYLSFIFIHHSHSPTIITHVLTFTIIPDIPWQIFPFRLRRSWRRRTSHGSLTLLSSSESEDPWPFLATWPHGQFRSGSNCPGWCCGIHGAQWMVF